MNHSNRYYYEVVLLRSSAPIFTYTFSEKIPMGRVVSVRLKSTEKEAVIIKVTTKPTFDTQEIVTVSKMQYTSKQMEIAKFISTYYFSSFSEALSLFLPYLREPKHSVTKNTEKIKAPILSHAQQEAYEKILQKKRCLLFGVTGAGKTEIFISLMFEMIKKGQTSIFLMPEISLTPQMEKRLNSYFGTRVAIWHSKLSKKKKRSILEAIYERRIDIVAGARSALFVPLENVGLIVVDEEHDDSYKSMIRPRYHARDVALLMAQKLGAKVLLASATPSPASYYKYDVININKPFKEGKKKYIFIRGNSVESKMLNALSYHYKQASQSLLFLPTRGNFKYLYCQNCAKTHLCPYCTVGMALHRNQRYLKCHYCNFTEAIVDTCTQCGSTPLSSERIGTQEAIEIISSAIEGIKIEQFDKDSITTAKKLKEALSRFESGESHLLLGTQMLSKGHDYANITLSIIMGLDFILGLADYRARERAMSLFYQIAGRSGRSGEAEVIIQTNDAAFFKSYLGDYAIFIKDELEFLEMADYPPFVSLARILIADKDEIKASKTTLDIATKLKIFKEIEIVGSGRAPVERIANKYRFHILLRSKNRVPLLKALHFVNCKEIEIDFDPVEFS